MIVQLKDGVIAEKQEMITESKTYRQDSSTFCRFARLFNVIMLLGLIIFAILIQYDLPNMSLNSGLGTYVFIALLSGFIISTILFIYCFFKSRLEITLPLGIMLFKS